MQLIPLNVLIPPLQETVPRYTLARGCEDDYTKFWATGLGQRLSSVDYVNINVDAAMPHSLHPTGVAAGAAEEAKEAARQCSNYEYCIDRSVILGCLATMLCCNAQPSGSTLLEMLQNLRNDRILPSGLRGTNCVNCKVHLALMCYAKKQVS